MPAPLPKSPFDAGAAGPPTTPCSAERFAASEHGSTHLRFATQALLDRHGITRGTELLFRWNAHDGAVSPLLGAYATCAALSHALMDGGWTPGLAQPQPPGDLFVNVDQGFLLSPLVEALTPDFAVIELLETVPLTEAIAQRVAELKARGYRFALDDVCSADDARWALAPHLEWVKLDVRGLDMASLADLVAKSRALGVSVLAEKVETAAELHQLKLLGVDLLQGYGVAPVITHGVPAWPGCDAVALGKLYSLAQRGEAPEALAAVACGDAAIVARLSRLHALLAPGQRAETLPELIAALPARTLLAWLGIFNVAATHGRRHQDSRAVWDQVVAFREQLSDAPGAAPDVSKQIFSLYQSLVDQWRHAGSAPHSSSTVRAA